MGTPTNSVHAGGTGNPLAELATATDAGKAVADLFACGGVEADGSNVQGIFLLVLTDDGMQHQTGNIPTEMVLAELMSQSPLAMLALGTPIGRHAADDSDPFNGL